MGLGLQFGGVYGFPNPFVTMKYLQKVLIGHKCIGSQEGSGAATMEGSSQNNVRESKVKSNFWSILVSIFHIQFFQFSKKSSTLFNYSKKL